MDSCEWGRPVYGKSWRQEVTRYKPSPQLPSPGNRSIPAWRGFMSTKEDDESKCNGRSGTAWSWLLNPTEGEQCVKWVWFSIMLQESGSHSTSPHVWKERNTSMKVTRPAVFRNVIPVFHSLWWTDDGWGGGMSQGKAQLLNQRKKGKVRERQPWWWDRLGEEQEAGNDGRESPWPQGGYWSYWHKVILGLPVNT